jgi:hypothetical protein
MSSDAGLMLLREIERTRIIITLPTSCPKKGLLHLFFDALAPQKIA